MGKRRGAERFLWGKYEGKNHLEELGVEKKIILKEILKKWTVREWNGLMWFGLEQVTGCCEQGNELLGFND